MLLGKYSQFTASLFSEALHVTLGPVIMHTIPEAQNQSGVDRTYALFAHFRFFLCPQPPKKRVRVVPLDLAAYVASFVRKFRLAGIL